MMPQGYPAGPVQQLVDGAAGQQNEVEICDSDDDMVPPPQRGQSAGRSSEDTQVPGAPVHWQQYLLHTQARWAPSYVSLLMSCSMHVQ
jgi:hypothetical protein